MKVFNSCPFEEAVQCPFEPCQVGKSLGPSWATFWFKLSFKIPMKWAGEEVQLHFDRRLSLLY
jgi:hypothetical protein